MLLDRGPLFAQICVHSVCEHTRPYVYLDVTYRAQVCPVDTGSTSTETRIASRIADSKM